MAGWPLPTMLRESGGLLEGPLPEFTPRRAVPVAVVVVAEAHPEQVAARVVVDRGQAGAEVPGRSVRRGDTDVELRDRKSTRLNSSHANISYALFCFKKNNQFVEVEVPRFLAAGNTAAGVYFGRRNAYDPRAGLLRRLSRFVGRRAHAASER